MKYWLLFLFTLIVGCKSSKVDYREVYLQKSHVIDITLPDILVTGTDYSFYIFTHPHVSEIQFNWYYSRIDRSNLMYSSTLHYLNNTKLSSPYDIKWGIESDFIVSYPGNWIIVVVTTDMYGETKVYNKKYTTYRF